MNGTERASLLGELEDSGAYEWNQGTERTSLLRVVWKIVA